MTIEPQEEKLSVTHSELVSVAAKWLERQRCTVIVTEIATAAFEQPDAIGWQGAKSILVECKASRADFKADADKPFRKNPESGMGMERFFLTPPGLVGVDELPPKWGLLEWNGKRVMTQRKSEIHPLENRSEHWVLLSLLKRIGSCAPKGVSIKCYTLETGNRATLGICAEEITE